MVVDVQAEPSFALEGPRELLSAEQLAAYTEGFDVSLGGERFLFVEDVATGGSASLVVVLNWTEELKRLVPAENSRNVGRTSAFTTIAAKRLNPKSRQSVGAEGGIRSNHFSNRLMAHDFRQ